MKVLNKDTLEELEDYDLSLGRLTKAIVIKKDAVPIDNETKFAWDDDDYEEAMLYVYEGKEVILNRELDQLKHNLSETDYIAAKAMDSLIINTSSKDFESALSSFNSEYADKLAQREEWRKRINEIEEELSQLKSESSDKEQN